MSVPISPIPEPPTTNRELLSYLVLDPRAKLNVPKDFVFEITNETDPTTDTSSDSEDNHDSSLGCLQQISPFFNVKETVYGGRGCFASCFIPKGTTVLECAFPVGSSVAKVFKKEVCFWCFNYDNGKTLKHRLRSKLYFCSEECLSKFQAYDSDETLANAIIAFDQNFGKNEIDIDSLDVPEYIAGIEGIEKTWKQIDEWDVMVSKTKPTKRARYLPKLSKDDFAEARYVISVVHAMYKGKNGPLAKELELFETLESSENQKVQKYPYLTLSYSNIFKFLRLTCPQQLQQFITPQNVRDIIGRNLTNAFGIWSETTSEDEDKEYLGFGVYPSASFFNHACSFNIKKQRHGSKYTFTTTEDIQPDTELCISYGISGDEDLASRESTLSEWFFKCGCSKCSLERTNI